MYQKFEFALIFIGAIAGLIFFIKILQFFLSKLNNLPPSSDHDDHIFYEDEFFDFDD